MDQTEIPSITWCAHRGVTTGAAPENSLEAVQAAVDAGIDAVEVDARHTRDGKLVLMHDATLDRTTTSSGLLGDRAMRELGSVFLKPNASRSGALYGIPTLEEAYAAVKGRAVLYIDVKTDRPELIGDFVRDHGAWETTILHCQKVEKAVTLARRDPRLRLHTIVNSRAQFDALAAQIPFYMIEVSSLPDHEYLDYLRSRAVRAEIDTMGLPDESARRWGLKYLWRRYVRSGCDFLMSDLIVELRAFARAELARPIAGRP